MSKPTVDEILSTLANDAYAEGYGDPAKIYDIDHAKAALRTLIDEAMERVIGDDFSHDPLWAKLKSNLKEQQRQRKATVLDELFKEEK